VKPSSFKFHCCHLSCEGPTISRATRGDRCPPRFYFEAQLSHVKHEVSHCMRRHEGSAAPGLGLEPRSLGGLWGKRGFAENPNNSFSDLVGFTHTKNSQVDLYHRTNWAPQDSTSLRPPNCRNGPTSTYMTPLCCWPSSLTGVMA
jgi:hypothetical protein